MQMRKPALCRFWLHALVSAARRDSASNMRGAATALQHLMRFVFTYTTAALPPHLKQTLLTECQIEARAGNLNVLDCSRRYLQVLLHEDAKLLAKATRSVPPPPPERWQQATLDNCYDKLIGLLIGGNQEPEVLMVPPRGMMIIEAIHNAPQGKVQAHVRGLGLVSCAFGPRHARAVCEVLVQQWSKREFWLERPQADVATSAFVTPSPMSQAAHRHDVTLSTTYMNAAGATTCFERERHRAYVLIALHVGMPAGLQVCRLESLIV